MSLHVIGMHGLGDNFYQRPAIAALARKHGPTNVYLETPWPQLYRGMGIRVVKPNSPLVNQRRNEDRVPAEWWSPRPAGGNRLELSIGGDHIRQGATFMEVFERQVGEPLNRQDFAFDGFGVDSPPRGVLVRPPTLRREWYNPSRIPALGVFERVVGAFRMGFPDEYRILDLPETDDPDEERWAEQISGVFCLVRAKTLEDLIREVRRSRLVICSPCFLVPMACALNVPVFVVFGGYVAPGHLFDPSRMTGVWGWVAPENPCECILHEHDCRKEISGDRIDKAVAGFLRNAA